MKKTIWWAKTGDESYENENHNWLLEGRTAAIVEVKAMKLHKKLMGDQMGPDKKSRPYIKSIELVGDLQG